jgi:hypothetical protein
LVYFIDKIHKAKYAIAYDKNDPEVVEAFDQEDKSINFSEVLKFFSVTIEEISNKTISLVEKNKIFLKNFSKEIESRIVGDVIKGTIDLYNKKLAKITDVFDFSKYKVKGGFNCAYNQLTSLTGAPREVGGNFYCHENQLTSLAGAPVKVGGNFYCDNNPTKFSKEDIQKAMKGDINEIFIQKENNMDKIPQYYSFFTDLIAEGHCIMADVPQKDDILEFIKKIPNECVYEEAGENNMSEYNVGTSGGYGGGAMAGGPMAPMGWAGTNSSPQTSRRLKDYPASRRYTYMQGNTVIGSSLYDTITKDDLTHPKFGPAEIMTGLRSEMRQLEYPDKDVARKIVIQNLEKNPKFYSDLDKYLKSDKLEETNMNQFDPKELAAGIKIEHEHTQDERLAQKIAIDHLSEDPHYYSKLNAAGLEEADIVVVGTTPLFTQQPQSSPQAPLTTSGLGKTGAPKPLTSPKTDAPETKLVRGNTIATTKTNPLNPNKESDPVDHFCGQIAGAMSAHQIEEAGEEDPNPPQDPTVKQVLDKVRAKKSGKEWAGHNIGKDKALLPGRKQWDNLSATEKIYAADRRREREESPENREIDAAEKATGFNNPHNKKPSIADKASLRDKFLQYRKNKSA